MSPPPQKREGAAPGLGSYGQDLSVPVSKWKQEGAFDTAAECEAAIVRTMDDLGKAQGSDAMPVHVDLQARMQAAASGARCVPADHIYPAAVGEQP
ncbi:MAG: hypothetical protein KIT14_00870 [bacterium]|nr:hypothetical protein [bacterium]